MLDREIEQHWQTVKESYPDAVVFHEAGGIFIVKGRDTEVLAKEFRIESGSRWYGFDPGQAWGYMSQLAERGYSVVRATGSGASPIEPPADRRKETLRQRKRGKFLALEARLLFEEKEIERATNDRWLKGRAYQRLFEQFQEFLREGDSRSLRGFGELYVYQVGDWYEVDFDLTSMLEGHVLLLAKAAFATGRKLPCKLVEPKCKRERRAARKSQAAPSVEQPQRLGQLGFADLLTGDW